MKNRVDYKKTCALFQRRKFTALPSDKNNEQCIGSHIFCRTKTRFITYYQLLCGKLEEVVHSCFVEQLFSKLLKIFKKSQVVGSDFSKFLQSTTIVKIDVLLGIIFHNCQANKYMTFLLNVLRICEESQVAFYYCTDVTLVVCYLYNLQRHSQNPVKHL